MKAQPAEQLALLDLQALDTRLSQLQHRRASVPELAELAALAPQADRLRDHKVALATQVSDLTRAQNRAEADVEQVRKRIGRDQALLDSGSLGSAKQMTDVQRELESLARRVTDLEDVELEVMEQLEAASERLAGVDQDIAALERKREALAATAGQATRDIDLEVARVTTERSRLAGVIPADLMGLYEKLHRGGGVAAAALHRGRCMGCQLQLTPAELGRLRAMAADEVCRCEECRAILVRTAESGL